MDFAFDITGVRVPRRWVTERKDLVTYCCCQSDVQGGWSLDSGFGYSSFSLGRFFFLVMLEYRGCRCTYRRMVQVYVGQDDALC